MKILQINKYFQLTGGGDRYFFDTAQILLHNGHRVIPFCIDYPGNIGTPYRRYFLREGMRGVEVEKTNLIIKAQLFLNGVYSLAAKQALKRLLNNIPIDIAHLHILHYTMSPSVIDVLYDFGIPIVFSLHDYRIGCVGAYLYTEGEVCTRCSGGRFYHAMIHKCYRNSLVASLMGVLCNYLCMVRRIYSKVTLFTVPHDEMRDIITNKFGIPRDRIRVLDNPFLGLNNISNQRATGKFILYFGQLSRNKGVFTFLDAARRLPDIPFIICGNGSDLNEIKTYIAKNAMSNVTVDVYSRRGSGLEAIIDNARIIVSPSEWPSPMEYSTIEALASGKAVIASDMGGNRFLITNNEVGRLFTAGNGGDLSKKIENLYHSKELCDRLGKNAKEMVEKRFTNDAYLFKLMAIYKEAIDQKKR